MKLVPREIVDLENKIEEIKIEKNKVVRSQRFEEAASLRDTEKRLGEELEKAKSEWNQYLKEKGVSQVNRLCLRVNNGKLEILVEQSDGTLILNDGTQKLENDLYIFATSKWSKILTELEALINKVDLREQELQDFFESYPELILDDKYDFPIPQATIISENNVAWRADFVLIPKDQVAFSKILELKLPNESISNKEVNGHGRYSAKLHHAISQLKDYYEAFNNDNTKTRFRDQYNTDLFKPDLQLLFGRKETIVNKKDFLELQRRQNVEITDWDTLLEQLKRKYK